MSFTAQTNLLLDRAGALCERRGSKLTGLRRHVLGLVLDSDKPAGAYEMLDQLRRTRLGAAPPTVYRALHFLLEQGLIHKVERLSAYVACAHAFAHEAEAHRHVAQFLICGTCHRVVELEDGEIGGALGRAAAGAGFRLDHATVEAEGTCAACAAH